MYRHTLLRDVFADTIRLACLTVKVEVGNSVTLIKTADILIHNWVQGKPAA